MKIQFYNQQLKALDGQPVEDAQGNYVMMHMALGSALVSGSEGEVLKFYDWALKMHNGIELDLDKSDQEVLKKFIKETKTLTILAKGQLLEMLDGK
jgi:cell division septal protein FtsQ